MTCKRPFTQPTVERAIYSVDAQRQRVVEIALSTLGTRYQHRQMQAKTDTHPGGMDCATSLYYWFYNAGLISEIVIPQYNSQWHLHREEPHYLNHIMQFGVEMDMGETKLPGDVILYRFGRQFAHAALVVTWPQVIQANHRAGGIVLADAIREQDLNFRKGKPIPQRLFRLKAWC